MPRAAVLGHPIGHSLSPVLHDAAYRALGLADWTYSAIDVETSDLPEVLTRSLLEHSDWAGFSLTMPLKKYVVPWLESLAVPTAPSGSAVASGAAAAPAATGDVAVFVDPLVQTTGSANTLVKTRAASGDKTSMLLATYNTDVYGIVAAIREVIRHGPVESIAILGAGATAASALAAAYQLGAEQIAVYSRAGASTDALARGLGVPSGPLSELRDSGNANVDVKFLGLAEFAAGAAAGDFDAVISTLPAHAADTIAHQLTETGSAWGGLGALLDVVYDPRPTDLLAAWSALGGAIVGGERMLLHQAARQVELMTGQFAPLGAMDAALTAALADSFSG